MCAWVPCVYYVCICVLWIYMSAGRMCECACVSSVCVCTHMCMSTVYVTRGMSQAPWDSDGRMLVYVSLRGKSSHFSTKCSSSGLLPFLPSAICTEFAETLKTSKGSVTFLLPACLSYEFFLSYLFSSASGKGREFWN